MDKLFNLKIVGIHTDVENGKVMCCDLAGHCPTATSISNSWNKNVNDSMERNQIEKHASLRPLVFEPLSLTAKSEIK